jgi:hypothetical protein
VIRVIRGPSLTVAVQKTVAARAAGEYDAMRRTMMAGDFVTIATFTTLPEAEAARLRIETEGIPTVITDAEIVNMDWLLGNAVGYIKLQVPAARAVAAQALLDQIAAERRERLSRLDDADEPTCLACGADMPDDADRCPACHWSWTDDRNTEA